MPDIHKTVEDIAVGDYYESCNFQPYLCTAVDGDNIEGTNLVTGAERCGCSKTHCGVRILTKEEAEEWRVKGPSDAKDHCTDEEIDRWKWW